MDYAILIVSVINTIIAALGFNAIMSKRASMAPPDDVHGVRLARAALAAARAQLPKGEKLEVMELAQRIFLELDLREDSKPDYSSRQAAFYVQSAWGES